MAFFHRTQVGCIRQPPNSSVKGVFNDGGEGSYITPDDPHAISYALFKDENDTVEDLMSDSNADDDAHVNHANRENGAEDVDANRFVSLKYITLAFSLNSIQSCSIIM